MRKKFRFLLLILFAFVCVPKIAKAVLIVPDQVVTGKVTIGWLDYEDKMGERPDSIDIEFYDMMNDEYVTKTFKAKDAIVNVSPSMTTWTFNVELPAPNDYIFYNIGVPPEIAGYEYNMMGSGGQIDIDGGTINLYFVKYFSKYVTYTEHWDDDGARDAERGLNVMMTPLNNPDLGPEDDFPMRLNCGLDEDTYIDDNTCQTKIYIPYIYPFDENRVPIWNDPTKFKYELTEWIVFNDYKIEVDDYGNIDVYIKHEPFKIDDSKVEVVWDDENNKNGKRPDEIILDLYNHDTKEQEIKVKDDTWESTITNLYKNYQAPVTSEYSLSIDNTNDYEFTVTGNNEDGFKVTAKYIGEEVSADEEENIKDDNIKDDNIEENVKDEEVNPKTNDNIIVYMLLFGVAILIGGCCIYKIILIKD